MTELTITELCKMENEINDKYRKCAEAINKVISAISARENCNGAVVSEGLKIWHLTESATEAEISAYRNSRRVVNGDDDIISFTFDGEVLSVSDVLKLDFGFHTTTEPTLLIVRYTCKKHHYFDKSKLENYIANMDDEDNKLILQYDSVEEKVLMVEDRTIDISVGIDDYVVDGKISSDDIAEIIYSNATKLVAHRFEGL